MKREIARVGLPLLLVTGLIAAPAPRAGLAATCPARTHCAGLTKTPRAQTSRPRTPYAATPRAETVSFRTSDGLTIRATLRLPPSTGAHGSAGAVASKSVARRHRATIFIHQGGSDRSEWADVAERLTARGYVTLAYDVRGHGKSDGTFDVALFDDPHRAPLDLVAALAFLRERDDVDPARIAVVGASIGANLAAMSTSELGVRTAVAISGKTSAVYALAGRDSLALRSVFYLASSGDQAGKRARWARELYGRTAEPRRVETAEGSSGHGVAVLRDEPEFVGLIFEWLDATL